MGGQSLQLPTQVVADHLTLYQPEQREQIVNPTLLIAQPALGTFHRPWAVCDIPPLSSFGVILPLAEKQVTYRFANYFLFLHQQLMHLYLKSILVNFFYF